MIVLRSLIICVAAAVVLANPDGAPDQACYAVAPGGDHTRKGTLPQSEASPYYLETYGTNYYYPGVPVRLSVKTRNATSLFKGFLVRSYDDMGKSFGRFTTTSSLAKAKKCDNDGDAATHTSNYPAKSSVELYWYPPISSRSSYVRFQMAVVESEYVFWTGLDAILQAQHGGQTTGSPRPNVFTVWGLLTAIVGAICFRQIWNRM